MNIRCARQSNHLTSFIYLFIYFLTEQRVNVPDVERRNLQGLFQMIIILDGIDQVSLYFGYLSYIPDIPAVLLFAIFFRTERNVR